MATRSAKKTTGTFSAEERAAMKERAAEAKRSKAGADGEADLLAKIKEMKGLDREIAEKLHQIVKQHAPTLGSRTWYGMPAWCGADGKAVIFFTPAIKFKERYATLGFNAGARLDEGNIWATSFAVTGLGDAVEKKIVALVKKAAG